MSCCIACYACNFTCHYNHIAIDDVTESMAKKIKAESKYTQLWSCISELVYVHVRIFAWLMASLL